MQTFTTKETPIKKGLSAKVSQQSLNLLPQVKKFNRDDGVESVC